MLSSFYVWLQVLGVVDELFLTLVIIFGIAFIFMLFITIMEADAENENPFKKPDADYNYMKDWKRIRQLFVWTRRVFIVLLITLLLTVVIPSKTQILTYVSLREVDKYNMSVEDSSLNPQRLVNLADNTVKTIEEISNIVKNYLGSDK